MDVCEEAKCARLMFFVIGELKKDYVGCIEKG